MLNIEKKIKDNDPYSYYLIVNELVDMESDITVTKENLCEVVFDTNNEVVNELLKYSATDLKKFFTSISFPKHFSIQNNHVDTVIFYFDSSYDINTQLTESYIEMDIFFNALNWSKSYSILKFDKALKESVKYNTKMVSSSTIGEDGAYFEGDCISLRYFLRPSISIGRELQTFEMLIKELIVRTDELLTMEMDDFSILSNFIFPENIKPVCNQYLVYFSQFMADLGVALDTEIKEEAKKTLFKIIPKDKDTALDQIRKALDIYLNIPTKEEINELRTSPDIAAKQWAANIMHLQSQILLSESILQAKNTTIDNLNLTLYQQNRQIATLSKPTEKPQKDEEKIFGGLISVGELSIEKIGIRVHFPELIRRLKRKMKK